MYTYIPRSPPSCVSLPPSLSHPSRFVRPATWSVGFPCPILLCPLFSISQSLIPNKPPALLTLSQCLIPGGCECQSCYQEWPQKAGSNLGFGEQITHCPADNEDFIPGGMWDTNSSRHYVEVQLLKLSLVVTWENVLVEQNTLMKWSINNDVGSCSLSPI